MKPQGCDLPSTRPQVLIVFVSMACAAYLSGLFLTYGFVVMPGLATVDDQTFVAAFQGLERTFDWDFGDGVNWPIIVSFIGGPVFCMAALVVVKKQPAVARPVAFALVALIAVIITSLLFNLPSNVGINEAGDPRQIGFDAGQVRADFDEGAWRAWNHVRSAISAVAFICLAMALYRQHVPGPDGTRSKSLGLAA